MDIPDRKSIKRAFDYLTTASIYYEGRVNAEVLEAWEYELQPVVDYLNWLAYKDEEWYKEIYPTQTEGQRDENSRSGT